MAGSPEVAPENRAFGGQGAGAGRVDRDQDAWWAWSGPVPLVLLELVLSCQACLSSGAASAVKGPCRSLQPSSHRRRGESGSPPSCGSGHCERLFPFICRAAAQALTWGTGCLGRQGWSPEGGESGEAKDVSIASEAPSVKWARSSPGQVVAVGGRRGSSADGESSVSGPGRGSQGFRTSRGSGEDPVGRMRGGEGSC